MKYHIPKKKNNNNKTILFNAEISATAYYYICVDKTETLWDISG